MLQIIINAVLLGSVYGIMSQGFSLMWGVMNILNLAAGTLIVVGAYLSYVFMMLLPNVNPYFTTPLVLFIAFSIGVVIQKFLYNRMVKGGLRRVLLLTFGLNMVIVDILLFIFKANYLQINVNYTLLKFKGIYIPSHRIIIFVIAWVLFLLTFLLFTKTKTGLIIRATAFNTEAAEICGVKIARTYIITTGIAIALGGVAGSMLGTIFSFSPAEGVGFLAKCFVICVIGGLGNVPGAMIGGLIYSLAEGVGGWIFGTQWQSCVGFSILYIVLALKPEGILARKKLA